MLVLSRKVGEEIIIDDHIRITVLSVQRETVRIGINAPKEVVVDRQEVHQKRKNPSNEWAEPEMWSYSWQEVP